MRNNSLHPAMNNTFNPSVVAAAWMPADNSEKRTKGQWHKWLQEPFTFFSEMIKYFTL